MIWCIVNMKNKEAIKHDDNNNNNNNTSIGSGSVGVNLQRVQRRKSEMG